LPAAAEAQPASAASLVQVALGANLAAQDALRCAHAFLALLPLVLPKPEVRDRQE
jgi:hypothetical protein